MSRMTEMVERIADRLPFQPLPRLPRNSNEVGDDEDQGLGGAAAQAHKDPQDVQ